MPAQLTSVKNHVPFRVIGDLLARFPDNLNRTNR
jgi:hypothetical protein